MISVVRWQEKTNYGLSVMQFLVQMVIGSNLVSYLLHKTTA